MTQASTLPALEALDFNRYAARRPIVVHSSENAAPDDLVKIAKLLRGAMLLIIRSLQIGGDIIAARIAAWIHSRIIHSLRTAWALGGIGWGGFLASGGLLLYLR